MEDWTVLLVDDEVEFISALAERLTFRGVKARTAANGEQALAAIEESHPRVVLLDLMMPGMSGLEVLQRIRKGYPDIQVILLTGHGSTREGMEGMRLGAFDYLMKPLNIDELLDKLRGAVGLA
ncbi:MAG: response regulator [Syntrophobacteraceae bacterium]|jgi:DNA-binding response OmpR family regulator|nr:response regulator [Syntrophobacteraceae bacterium]